ncbi:unnamed protein product [Chrysoparadoxa australica]
MLRQLRRCRLAPGFHVRLFNSHTPGFSEKEGFSQPAGNHAGKFGKGHLDRAQDMPTFVRALGKQVLGDPLVNKGAAFLWSERERFHLRGLLPPRMVHMDHQVNKMMAEFREGVWDQAARDPNDEMVQAGLEADNIRKWRFLSELQDYNETLFYRCLIDNFPEMASIVYTPTIGWFCLNYSRLFRNPRGMYFSAKDKGYMMSLAYNWPSHEVDAIVVTDGSRILGLGDLGLNGIGISIGKLSLFVAAGGFHPSRILPCCLDVGTNNEALRADPTYLGLDQPRMEGEEYLAIVDEFIASVKARWPNCLIQFEDFRTEYAKLLLDRYRHEHLCFNDDIQGTGCTALAGVLASLAVQGKPSSAIKDLTFVVCGAGSAGMALALTLWISLAMERHGLTQEEAALNFWVLDQNGLITTARSDIPEEAAPFARPEADLEGKSLLEIVKHANPGALVGLSGAGRIWDQETLKALGDGAERPLVFPMSNPTSRSECTAEEAQIATQGRAIFAAGSPFEDVEYMGKTIPSSQGNNLYIFPGLALGAKLGQARIISDGMLYAASEALAATNKPEDLARGSIFPGLNDIRYISRRVAAAVILQALEEGELTNAEVEEAARQGDEALEAYIQNAMYNPVYSQLVYVPPGVLE